MLVVAVIVLAGLMTMPLTYRLADLILVDPVQRSYDRRFAEIVAEEF